VANALNLPVGHSVQHVAERDNAMARLPVTVSVIAADRPRDRYRAERNGSPGSKLS
jgi:hypothetical protein